MKKEEKSGGTDESAIHIPVIVANCAPFRLLLRNDDSWVADVSDINNKTYDYVKLSRLSGSLDVGIKPYSMMFSFDGSLILPAIDDYRIVEKALDKFNETLGILLLGGLYSEAVQPDDLSPSRLFINGYLKHTNGRGLNGSFHMAIRTKHISPLDAMRLYEPLTITIDQLSKAYTSGKEVFDKITGLSPSLLLNGVSNYVKKQWGEALIFLWTSIEQLLDLFWRREILMSAKDDGIDNRLQFLKDFRTWTASAKTEVLYQGKFIGIEEYALINIARKARNNFIHNAAQLDSDKVKAALNALFRLISLYITDYKDSDKLESVLQSVYDNQRAGLYPKIKRVTLTSEEAPRYILKLPNLPGDPNWKGDYQIIDELVLKQLKSEE